MRYTETFLSEPLLHSAETKIPAIATPILYLSTIADKKRVFFV